MGKVSLSDQPLMLADVARHYSAVTAATYEFFANSDIAALAAHPSLSGYVGLSVDAVRSQVLDEIDRSCTFSVLACAEAAIRSDYLRRVYDKEKDNVSRAFREIHKIKESRARLCEDLLSCWRENSDVSKVLIGNLVGAFDYRNWLAHGRYWTPKFGRKYDFSTVYHIASELLSSLSLNDEMT